MFQEKRHDRYKYKLKSSQKGEAPTDWSWVTYPCKKVIDHDNVYEIDWDADTMLDTFNAQNDHVETRINKLVEPLSILKKNNPKQKDGREQSFLWRYDKQKVPKGKCVDSMLSRHWWIHKNIC